MTRSDLSKRSAAFVTMVVAGYFLGTYLEQRFAPLDSEMIVISQAGSPAANPKSAKLAGAAERHSKIGSTAAADRRG